jgi:hypothetical protein|tara:strand:+ start:1085 stop:1630 length:546 start_codon:yes stop_codon:yes gene_type:complete
MGIFDIFKKKEEKHYDPTDIKVTDLENGYLLDYDFETWTVTKMSEYDWGSNFFTREFTITSKDKVRYLHIEDDGKLIITLSEEIKFRKLGVEVLDHIELNGKPPKKINFLGITYFLDEKSPGFYRNTENESWEELISFDYLDDDEKKCLSISQWGDDDFEASFGEIIKPIDISNILPSYSG